MWVRSQDYMELHEISQLIVSKGKGDVDKVTNEREVLWFIWGIKDDRRIILAEYETKEKAIEVVDEFEYCLNKAELVRCKAITVETAKEKIFIYQMPAIK